MTEPRRKFRQDYRSTYTFLKFGTLAVFVLYILQFWPGR